jgi:hypothetical protein
MAGSVQLGATRGHGWKGGRLVAKHTDAGRTNTHPMTTRNRPIREPKGKTAQVAADAKSVTAGGDNTNAKQPCNKDPIAKRARVTYGEEVIAWSACCDCVDWNVIAQRGSELHKGLESLTRREN